MTPKTSSILWWPKKLSTKYSYPNNIIFSENPKKYLKFCTTKNGLSLRMYENIRVSSLGTACGSTANLLSEHTWLPTNNYNTNSLKLHCHNLHLNHYTKMNRVHKLIGSDQFSIVVKWCTKNKTDPVPRTD